MSSWEWWAWASHMTCCAVEATVTSAATGRVFYETLPVATGRNRSILWYPNHGILCYLLFVDQIPQSLTTQFTFLFLKLLPALILSKEWGMKRSREKNVARAFCSEMLGESYAIFSWDHTHMHYCMVTGYPDTVKATRFTSAIRKVECPKDEIFAIISTSLLVYDRYYCCDHRSPNSSHIGNQYIRETQYSAVIAMFYLYLYLHLLVFILVINLSVL